MEFSEYLTTVESIHTSARQRGLSYLTCEDDALRGRTLRLQGRDVLSFASCSYLGIEHHPALVEGVIDAVRRFGTMFSYSRYYVAAPPYREMESLLSELFGGHALITQSTSMGHLTVLPVLANAGDAIVMDNQAHMSMQTAVTQSRARGATLETVRHFELDEKVVETVERLARRHRRVYFVIDGVYSMYGDCAPINLIQQVLDVAPNVRVYVDDAHGMSWAGKHGRGWFLSKMPLSDRIVFGTSLVKAFSASGGCFVFADEAEREYVRMTGAPYIYSGPIQPPMMGAIIAAAKLHLSPEITELQRTYRERIELTNRLMLQNDLPLLSRNESPIFFLRMGKIEAAQTLAERLLQEGYYVSVSNYPTVPLKRAGMRLTVGASHTPEEIEGMISALAHHLPRVHEEFGIERAELDHLFARAIPKEARGGIELGRREAPVVRRPSIALTPEAPAVRIESFASIREVDQALWDRCMQGHGISSWESLAINERVFSDPDVREFDWDRRYFVARGAGDAVVGATYVTRCLVKDDMFMRQEVSELAEVRRSGDPYFLSTDVLMLGSPGSEGNHIYLSPEGPRDAARDAILAAIEAQAEAWEVDAIVLRDFPGDDPEMDEWMQQGDWMKVPILETNRITMPLGESEEEMIGRLTGATRRGFRARRYWQGLLEASAPYTMRIYGAHGEPLPDAGWVPYLHELYRNVADRGLRINDYGLPVRLIPELLASPAWEIVALHLDPAHGGPADGRPVAWGACHIHGDQYAPFVCGIDYGYVDGHEYGAYRQLLLHVTRRARELNMVDVHLGFDAEREKRRFGAVMVPTCMYMRTRRHDHGEQLHELVTELGLTAYAVA